MAPPLIFLIFVIGIAALIGIGLFVAARTGLWVRETSTKGPLENEVPTRGRASRGREGRFDRDGDDAEDRPEHVTREDPTKARTFGT
jgi:hypothetical protein